MAKESEAIILKTIRSIALPCVLLVFLWSFSSSMGASSGYADSGEVGFLSYSLAQKLLNCATTVAILLLLFRLTTTVGFEVFLKRKRSKPLPRILKSMVGIAFFILGAIISLYILMEGKVSGILAFSGALSIVLGIALRPIILDAFSGLSANLDSAFQIGDWIGVEGAEGSHVGWVEQINWRTTHIRTRAGNIVVCPNSFLSTSIVTNHSRPYQLSRYDINVQLPCDIPIDRGRSVLEHAVQAALNKDGGPSDGKKPDVLVTSISGNGINYWVRFWLDPSKDSYDSATHVVNESVNKHLRMAGITLAVGREEIRHARLQEQGGYFEYASNRFEVIRSLEIFRGLGEDSLRKVAESASVERFRVNQDVILQGDLGTSMYILSEGVLRVELIRGQEVLHLGMIEPGQFFGEMSLLTGEPRSANVTCETDCVVFVIDRHIIRALMDESAKCMEILSSNVASRKLGQEDAISRLNSEESVKEEQKLQRVIFQKMKEIFRGSRAPVPISDD